MFFLLTSNARCSHLFRWRAVSVLLLAAYVPLAVGVPLPLGKEPQKTGELFPCSGCGCGCSSAEQCWRSCCCHTFAERMAWARKHGVRPPAYAVAAARRAGLDVGWLTSSNGSCHDAGAATCCAASSAGARPACCEQGLSQASAKSATKCCGDQGKRQQEIEPNADQVVGWRAFKCQGHSGSSIVALPTSLVVRCHVSDDFALVRWLGPNDSDRVSSFSLAPLVPPPERV